MPVNGLDRSKKKRSAVYFHLRRGENHRKATPAHPGIGEKISPRAGATAKGGRPESNVHSPLLCSGPGVAAAATSAAGCTSAAGYVSWQKVTYPPDPANCRSFTSLIPGCSYHPLTNPLVLGLLPIFSFRGVSIFGFKEK